jgi:hypothetical protein
MIGSNAMGGFRPMLNWLRSRLFARRPASSLVEPKPVSAARDVSLLLLKAASFRDSEIRMRGYASNQILPFGVRYRAAVVATDLADQALAFEQEAICLDPRCR